jgi:hypothetical protein
LLLRNLPRKLNTHELAESYMGIVRSLQTKRTTDLLRERYTRLNAG